MYLEVIKNNLLCYVITVEYRFKFDNLQNTNISVFRKLITVLQVYMPDEDKNNRINWFTSDSNYN